MKRTSFGRGLLLAGALALSALIAGSSFASGGGNPGGGNPGGGNPGGGNNTIDVLTVNTLTIQGDISSDFEGSQTEVVLISTITSSPTVPLGSPVHFKVDNAEIGTATTTGGVAQIPVDVSSLAPGPHEFKATFPALNYTDPITSQKYHFDQANTSQNTVTFTIVANQPPMDADVTPPATVCKFSVSSSLNEWYKTGGILTLTSTDAESGVASIEYSVDGAASITVNAASVAIPISGDGIHTVHFCATDVAGNDECITPGLCKSCEIKIDGTAPTITGAASPGANANGWNNTDVAVNFTYSDATSGIDTATFTGNVVLTAEGEGQSASASVSDLAGNTNSAMVSGINIDKTAPTITGAPDRAPNGAGWYNANVTVSYSVNDGLSGIDPATVPADDVLNSDGADQSAMGSVMDLAGNPASTTVIGINIDKTKPVINALSPVTATATSTLGAIVNYAAPTGSDALSGLVSINAIPASGSQFGPGLTIVTVTATDVAGNVQTDTFTVSVTYSWSGFLQPINADGSSIFKAGSTVPVKFQLTGDSASITNLSATLSYAKMTGTAVGTVNEAASTSAATVGSLFRYDATSGQYIFNWSTKGLATGCYQLSVDFGDGVARTIKVSLK